MPLNKEQFSSCAALRPSKMSAALRAAGFIDAEGNFQVFLDRLYLRVMFRIRLHKDEINVLNKIQEILGVGKVLIDGNSVVFIISNVKDLINVLFPLLDKYNLFTTKWLDYIDFKKVVLSLSSPIVPQGAKRRHERSAVSRPSSMSAVVVIEDGTVRSSKMGAGRVQPLPEFLQMN